VGQFSVGSNTYTEHEYRTWLTAAGFAGMERVYLTGAVSLITARKPT
jgi:hypothetical protein